MIFDAEEPPYFLSSAMGSNRFYEDQLDDPGAVLAPVVAEMGGADAVAMCIQLEAEAAVLTDDEQSEMLEGLGVPRATVAPAPAHVTRHEWGLA